MAGGSCPWRKLRLWIRVRFCDGPRTVPHAQIEQGAGPLSGVSPDSETALLPPSPLPVPCSLIPAILPSMSVLNDFRRLTRPQRHTFLAAFLGWTMDSLDYFMLILCAPAIAGRVPHPALGGDGRGLLDAGLPAGGRGALWHAGRPLRPPAGADGEYSQLLGDRAGLRLCSLARCAAYPARALWPGDGRRVGRGRGAGL